MNVIALGMLAGGLAGTLGLLATLTRDQWPNLADVLDTIAPAPLYLAALWWLLA